MHEVPASVIEDCKRGNPDAFERIVAVYGPRLHALCQRMGSDSTDADDLVQQVFLRLIERIGTFKHRSRFSTWLFRLTINEALNARRAAIRRRRTNEEAAGARDPHDSGADPMARAARSEARDRIEALLESLSPEHRAVIVLRELLGLSYAEMAAVLDVPRGTIMSRLSRARDRFRDLLDRRRGRALGA